MKEFDVFKLGCELGFDIRGAELSEQTNSLIIVDETNDFIPGFNSNKVIAYNCKKDINIKRNSVALLLKKYITAKSKGYEKIVFSEVNRETAIPCVDINLLVEECLQNSLIKNKKRIKTLYK